MANISVAEAADRLGVSVPRIHQRIADGSVRAERIGSQWVVDEASLAAASEARSGGRPLSPRSAWSLVALSRSDDRLLAPLAPAERSRAKARLSDLLVGLPKARGSEADVRAAASLLRSRLRMRGERRLFRASPRDLPDLRADGRVALSGVSHQGSGIAAGDLVEGYVSAADVVDVAKDYLLSAAKADADANVILHIAVPAGGPVDVDAPLLLAADLAEHRRPREEGRAVEILRRIVRDHPELVAEGNVAEGNVAEGNVAEGTTTMATDGDVR